MRRIVLLLSFLVMTALSLACRPQPEPPLRVGLAFWPPHGIPMLAQRLGYIDDVEFIPYRSLAEQLRAYRNGNLDAIATTADYFLQLLSRDPEHLAVLVVDYSAGADALLARPGIDSLADLRGRTIALETSGVGAYLLARALQQAGLGLHQVKLRSIDSAEPGAAFADPSVDAVVTYEPTRGELLRQGARELFSSRDIPGEIVDLLIVRREVARERGQAVGELVEGWLAGQAFLEQNPGRAAALLAPESESAQANLLESLRGVELPAPQQSRRLLAGPSPELAPALRRHARLMQQLGVLAQPPEPAAVEAALTADFIEAAP